MSRTRRTLAVAVIWTAATIFALAFAELTKVGPVLLTLARGHGVHVGDVVALLAAYTEAVILTRRLFVRRT